LPDAALDPAGDEEIDLSALFTQTVVDQARLAQNIRSLLPPRSSATLDEIIDFCPVQQGAAEIIGYLSLSDDDLVVTMDESEETLVAYSDPDGTRHRARLPKVTVSRL
jgi:hypothetical protein